MIESLWPLCLVFPDSTVHLAPGYPVYFSDDQARRVLERAGRKVRVLNDDHAPRELMEGKPVRWKSDSGHGGPAIVHIIDYARGGRWLLVWHEGNPRWVHETRVVKREDDIPNETDV